MNKNNGAPFFAIGSNNVRLYTNVHVFNVCTGKAGGSLSFPSFQVTDVVGGSDKGDP